RVLFRSLLTLAMSAATATAPAGADAAPVTRMTLDQDVPLPAGTTTSVVRQAVDLAAGESRHIRGRINTTSRTTRVVALSPSVLCSDSPGPQVSLVTSGAGSTRRAARHASSL